MEQNDLCPATVAGCNLHFSLNAQTRKNSSGLEVPLRQANSDIFRLTLYFVRKMQGLLQKYSQSKLNNAHSLRSSKPRRAPSWKVPHKASYKLISWPSSWSLLLCSGEGVTYCWRGCSTDLSLMKQLSWMLNYPSSCPDFPHPRALTENLLAAKGKKHS